MMNKKQSHLLKESEKVIVGQTISSVETLYASIVQSNLLTMMITWFYHVMQRLIWIGKSFLQLEK